MIARIVENVLELSGYIENYVDNNECESLEEQAREEMVDFLCKLAMSDDEVVMAEIRFINDLFGTTYNLLDVKKRGRMYDDTGAYVVPYIIEKACEFDENNDEELNAAQTIVNAFYYLGVEFIACDDEVAASEIKMLTEFVDNYQNYVNECGVDGESLNFIEDLKTRKYLKSQGDNNKIMPQIKDKEEVDVYQTESRLISLIREIEIDKFNNVRQDLMTLINYIRVKQIREKRGLKHTSIPKTMLLFGGTAQDAEDMAKIVAEIFNIDGVTNEKFVTKYTCTESTTGEHIEKTLEMANAGNVLVVNANYLSKSEIDKIMYSVRNNNNQVIILSGDMNRLISFLEKNRNMNTRFNRSLYLDGINEDIICDIFEFLCVENDYKASEGAKALLKKHYREESVKFDPYYIFQIFDRAVKAQNQRILEDSNLDSDKMVTINKADLEIAIV